MDKKEDLKRYSELLERDLERDCSKKTEDWGVVENTKTSAHAL